jgi:hypothetical protein
MQPACLDWIAAQLLVKGSGSWLFHGPRFESAKRFDSGMNKQLKPVFAALLGAAMSLSIPSQAQTTAKSEAECRLSENGAVVYEDDCSVRQSNQDGQVNFVVKLDNGNSFRFVGPNRQNLRLDNGFGGFTNVLFEDKGAKGVFTWSDGNRTRKLVVKTVGTSSNSNSSGSSSNSLVLGPPVPDLQYLVGQTPVSAALGFIIRGTKYVRAEQVSEGTLTYMLDKKRCVVFLTVNDRYMSVTFADANKCVR